MNSLNPPYLNSLFTVHKVPYDIRDPFKLIQPRFTAMTFGFRSFKWRSAFGLLGITVPNSGMNYLLMLKTLLTCQDVMTSWFLSVTFLSRVTLSSVLSCVYSKCMFHSLYISGLRILIYFTIWFACFLTFYMLSVCASNHFWYLCETFLGI